MPKPATKSTDLEQLDQATLIKMLLEAHAEIARLREDLEKLKREKYKSAAPFSVLGRTAPVWGLPAVTNSNNTPASPVVNLVLARSNTRTNPAQKKSRKLCKSHSSKKPVSSVDRTSSEASVNPGGGQNPSGFCEAIQARQVPLWDQEGFGMPELESAKREGLHERQHRALF